MRISWGIAAGTHNAWPDGTSQLPWAVLTTITPETA